MPCGPFREARSYAVVEVRDLVLTERGKLGLGLMECIRAIRERALLDDAGSARLDAITVLTTIARKFTVDVSGAEVTTRAVQALRDVGLQGQITGDRRFAGEQMFSLIPNLRHTSSFATRECVWGFTDMALQESSNRLRLASLAIVENLFYTFHEEDGGLSRRCFETLKLVASEGRLPADRMAASLRLFDIAHTMSATSHLEAMESLAVLALVRMSDDSPEVKDRAANLISLWIHLRPSDNFPRSTDTTSIDSSDTEDDMDLDMMEDFL